MTNAVVREVYDTPEAINARTEHVCLRIDVLSSRLDACREHAPAILFTEPAPAGKGGQ